MVNAQMIAMLNDSQREAATSAAPVILTLAGAGTGKTRTLTHRVAYLHHERRVGTANMLCLTFSRLAGKEVKERILPLIGAHEAKKLFCNTFHAFAVMVLRQHGDLIGIDHNFSIYDEEDRKAVIEEAIQSFGSRTSYKKVIALLEENKHLERVKMDCFEEHRVMKEYAYVLKRNNAVDLDRLICSVNVIWRNHPDVLAQYRKEYIHVLVDEFQDTNDEQMELLQLLNPENLFVVGDDFQAIYGWRQAKVEYILTFQERYPGCAVIKLQDNYRSSRGIVEIANRLISYNENQSSKVLMAHRNGITPVCKGFPDEMQEARFIAEEIKKLTAGGHELKRIAVLARTNAQVQRVKNILDVNEIPAQVVSNSGDVFKRTDIKLMFSWIEAVNNPRDAQNLKRIFSFPKSYFTKSEIGLMEFEALANDVPLLDVIEQKNIRKFLDDYEAVKRKISELQAWSPSLCMRALVEALDLGAHYEQQGLKNRLQDAEAAYAACVRWERSKDALGEDKSISAFLRWLRYRDMQEKLMEDKDAVKLMTVHASKGLEFETVFVIGLAQGVFPSKKTHDLEEERRLFYVALTRAEERLTVTWPEEIEPSWGGQPQPADVSQFILESGLVSKF